MIEYFTIFGKGGLVLWYFNEGSTYFKDTVDDLIGTVIFQGRNHSSFSRDNVTVKYKQDNEFDIIILVVYQSIIQMAYADKLLTEVQIRFRDLYKNVLSNGQFFLSGTTIFNEFTNEFNNILSSVQNAISDEQPKPRTFKESEKSKKTVASMIETAADRAAAKSRIQKETAAAIKKTESDKKHNKANGSKKNAIIDQSTVAKISSSSEVTPHNSPRNQKSNTEIDEDVLRNRSAMFQKLKGKSSKVVNKEMAMDSNEINKKQKKTARVWDLAGTEKDLAVLDYSAMPNNSAQNDNNSGNLNLASMDGNNFYKQNAKFVGKFKGELPGLTEEDDFLDVKEDLDNFNENNNFVDGASQKQSGGWFSSFKSLVGNKQLTQEDMEPALERMKEILIAKNVAAEPAMKISESVGSKLEGKVIGTFNRITTIVREAMRESLIQLLTPKRRVNILRDVMEAKSQSRPYVIVFCGVNGVGKSTNLAKITFWLNENNHRVLIAAGDTFRAGAVEQLRTHTCHLNALHPQGVQLYEQGYGKDPAGLASAAIQIAKEREIDVVLVDTAGRMQDNEPLMRSLSKLIRTNDPDLVLFVGEALVGNEAVDQLVKFNQSLADNSAIDSKPRLIDGIVLTKFDTIDDKVGAAVSMTYITGQPIVFVGTGQTYKDLKNLNVNAVVNSLLK